jgi:hypothetical protein
MQEAARLRDVFGPLDGAGAAARQSQLRGAYAQLAKFVHPDHVELAFQARAKDVFHRLTTMRDKAQEALAAGTYDTLDIAVSTSSTVELISPSRRYVVDEDVFAEGDFSLVHAARAGSEQYLLKIAREPTCNAALERDIAIRARFRDTAFVPDLRLARFVPATTDTFLVSQGTQRLRVEAQPLIAGFLSVAQILAAYPGGLPPEDAGWIARRVLAQALAAQAVRVVHTAIIPDHVLVHPLSREPLHLGWAHALENNDAARVTQIVGRAKSFYPPEVFARERVDASSDIYMAGKIITALFGGDVERNTLPRSLPEPVRRSILACTQHSPARRPQSARDALDGFTRAIRDAWGKTYRPLTLPVRTARAS